jgi:hypothetical protein
MALEEQSTHFPNLSENSGFLTIEKCSRGLVELDRASARVEIMSWFSVNWKKWPWLLANRVRVVQVSC